MPAAHLDAILAHELAHIRRSDFLVNVLQSAAEVCFSTIPRSGGSPGRFASSVSSVPTTWRWPSQGDRLTYAAALTSLESLRAEPLAIAMVSGDDLLTRVRRLLEPDVATRPRISGGFAMTVAMLLLLFAVTGAETGGSAANAVATMDPVPPAASATVAAPVGDNSITAPQSTATPPPRDPKPQPVTQTAPPQVSGVIRDKTVVSFPASPSPSASLKTHSSKSSGDSPHKCDWLVQVSGSPTRRVRADGVDAGFRTNRTRLNIVAGQSPSVVILLELGSLSEHVTIRTAVASEAPRPNTLPPTTDEFFDLAKSYYRQGRLVEAEEMTKKALAQMRSETPAATAGPVPALAPGSPVRVGGDVLEPKKIRDVQTDLSAGGCNSGHGRHRHH
jgi:hypothetical protein